MTPLDYALTAGLVLLLILLCGPATITELRNTRTTEWLRGYEPDQLAPDPVPEWAATTDVRVPALTGPPPPTKRRLTGHERRFPVAWVWEPSTVPARYACDGRLVA